MSMALRMTSRAASISASSSGVRNRAASIVADPSRIIRNDNSSARPTSSTRASRTICLRSAPEEKGRTSGPLGSPGA